MQELTFSSIGLDIRQNNTSFNLTAELKLWD